FCYRRLTIRGHDGSLHPFAVQYPSARHSRREERMLQLFRILNSVIEHHKESRKRNLSFHLPLIIPFAPQVRIVQDDPSYCSLQDIYEDHCDDIKISKDEPIIYFINKMKSNISHTITRKDVINLKIEIARNIQSKYIPNDFIAKTIKSHEELWSFKKHFTSQMASVSFMTYLICVGQRHPHKFLISRNTGNIWSSELIPSFAQGAPMFQNQEPVPFRFTRSIQQFMTPIGIEGIFSSAMLAIGRCLTEPEFDLGQYLSIFIRDELITWHYISQKHPNDQLLRQKVLETVDQVVNKAKMIGNIDSNCDKNGNRSMYSSISDLIAMASNPQNLANMEKVLETVDQVVNKAKMIGNIDSNCDKNGNRSMYSSISDLIAMASNPQNLANMESNLEIVSTNECHKNLLEDQVQPFLDIVKEMYANMEKAVRDAFDTPGTAVATPSASTPVQSSMPIPPSPRPSSPVSDVTTNESTPNKVLADSLHSFKSIYLIYYS
ncbi:15982_t:CDS:10, partial [Entrophospora sp. SA101]